MSRFMTFALPLLLWSLVSYVPFVWHPLVHVHDPGDVNVPGQYSYVAKDQLISMFQSAMSSVKG